MMNGSTLSASSSWEVLPCRLPMSGSMMATSVPSRRKIVVVGVDRRWRVFDVDAQTWAELPLILPWQHPLTFIGAVLSLENTIYVLGKNRVNAVMCCITLDGENAQESAWQSLFPATTRRSGFGAAMVVQDQTIVVAGGRSQLDLKSAEVFDIRNNTWSTLPDMFERRKGCVAASVGNKVFVFGGVGDHRRVCNTAECLDLSCRTWESLPTMPHARCLGAAVTVGWLVLLIGGFDENHKKLGVVDCFNTFTRKWIPGVLPPLVTARSTCAATVFDDHVYVFGGWSQDDLDTMERIRIDPYWIITPRLCPLFRQDDLPLGLWPHILAGCQPKVVYFILLSEKFQLDSVLPHSENK